MLLMLDNYDSFTFNLVHYLEMLGENVNVYRNDVLSINAIEDLHPEKIIISPGPGRPETAGITLELIEKFAGKIPILGICLGHQAIAQTFGAKIVNAKKVMHGKLSAIHHQKKGIFQEIDNPFQATRYHSLLIDPNTLSDEFIVTAWTEDKEIMGIQHQQWPLYGLQFHPESVLTEQGHSLLKNFVIAHSR